MRTLRTAVFTLGLLALGAAGTPSVEAGCGCSKPPPPPAAMRPNVAYAGAPISFFGSNLVAGQKYSVTFTSGINNASATVTGIAGIRRDLADSVAKVQLVVPLPTLPLGPARISVTGSTAAGVIMSIADTSFTVAPTPVALVTAGDGEVRKTNYQAAIGRDGTVYVSLDVTGVTEPKVLDVQAKGFPLRFGSQDVVFYNIQGFTMQKLVAAGTTTPIPGMFVIPAKDPNKDSDVMHYSRHEFETYFLQHQERQPHAVDPTDPNWHLDGTPHVDHDHLILAIMGRTNAGKTPAPGASPSSTLEAHASSLFYQGLTAKTSLTLSGKATIDSYTRRSSYGWDGTGWEGDVFTNGTLSVTSSAKIYGSAAAKKITTTSSFSITGARTLLSGTPTTFMDIIVPTLLPSLGVIQLKNGYQKISGPGSFLVTSISLQYGSRLWVDNEDGPVTLYVLGGVTVSDASRIDVSEADPEKFAIYVASKQAVTINADCYFSGVIYAPQSTVTLSGVGGLYGAFLGDTVTLNDDTRVHYDSSLRGE
jgi:hypothetical protein